MSSPDMPSTKKPGARRRKNSVVGRATGTATSGADNPENEKLIEKMKEQALQLSDYTEIAHLGSGALAQVKLVKHKASGEYYALKVMDKANVVNVGQVENVLREKDCISSMNHPMIISASGSFQDPATIYLVLQYVPGGDLFSSIDARNIEGTIEDCRLPMNEAVFYSACIASCLEHAHSCSIIYRDLKPENLLVDKDGYIKMADFGFAKKLEGFGTDNRTFTLCGTPEHVSPEIITKKGHANGADWWAAGINTFEFITGEPPFTSEDDDPVKTYELILNGEINWPEDMPVGADTKDFITQLLHPDQDLRLGSKLVPYAADGQYKSSASAVLEHPFFSGIDWELLKAKKIVAGYKPTINGMEDTSNFLSNQTADGEGIQVYDTPPSQPAAPQRAAPQQARRATAAPKVLKPGGGCCGGPPPPKPKPAPRQEPEPTPEPAQRTPRLSSSSSPEIKQLGASSSAVNIDQAVFAKW